MHIKLMTEITLRAAIPAAANHAAPSPWTAERTQLALRLWRAGLSARAIAAQLGEGVSRCAVLAKMHRERTLAGRAPPSNLALPQAAAEGTGRAPPRPAKRDIHRSLVRNCPAAPSVDAETIGGPPPLGWRPPRAEYDHRAFAPLEGSRPRRWLTRRAGECAWPVEMKGAEDATYSCCRPAAPRRQYCEAHLTWALEPERPTPQMLEQEADQLARWLARRGA